MMQSSDDQQFPTSPRKTVSSRYVTIPLFTLLVISVIWLYIEVGRLRVPTASLGIVTLASRVETNGSNISSLSSDLSYVTAIAENANRYAHSHYSDSRLKTKISSIPSPLENLLNLNGVTYYWIEDDVHNFPNSPQIGFIAQEVELVYPELVYEDPEGYEHVDYAKLTPVLVEAIREQQEQISSLQVQNADLEARLDYFESVFQEILGAIH